MSEFPSTNIYDGRPVEICKYCGEECHKDVKFSERIMQRFKLEIPMHFDCTIEAIVDRKLKGKGKGKS
jgi:hypothetical protein